MARAHETSYKQLAFGNSTNHAVAEDTRPEFGMKIIITSVLVDDQAKALRFYTEKLGFEKKHDVPLGEHRWLTVTSPGDNDGVELLLEYSDHPAVQPFKDAIMQDGIPWTMFGVDDIEAEHQRLTQLGVVFTQPPTKYGNVTTAVFDDTCGNLIQLLQQHEPNDPSPT